ncbi:MAG: hypothetical protein H7Y02_05985 [Candidatus Obscuribacterales bacterium]|nr:hypothetical protein [Steroidobacteraceae bacterium]
MALRARSSLRISSVCALGAIGWLTLGLLTLAAEAADVGKTKGAWRAPRTESGQPDLQGVWTNATITRLERSTEFGDRLILTDAEAKVLEEGEEASLSAGDAPSDLKQGAIAVNAKCDLKGFSGVDCAYNSFWISSGTQVVTVNGEKRSSIIVEPRNGRVPPLTPARQAFMAERARNMRGNFDGPEARPLGERCLLSFGSSSGPPMLPSLYNNNYQITQTKDTVIILVEMVHDARIVRLGGQHLPKHIRKWMGDSIGRWEGDTLVVETTNFNDKSNFRGATENLKVIERFTRVSPHAISYQFRIEDAEAFTQPWAGELTFTASDEKIYEYACHEGNYALPGILAGAREAEKTPAAAKP